MLKLLIAFIIIILIALNARSKRKAIERIKKSSDFSKNNSQMYGNREEEKSKKHSVYNGKLEISKAALVFWIIVILMPVVVALIVIYKGSYSELPPTLPMWTLVFSIIILNLGLVYYANRFKKKLFSSLQKKYGLVEKLKNPAPIITEGKKSEIGNIRNRFYYACKISKYNCVFLNYYKEILVNERHYSFHRQTYTKFVMYRAQANRIQYCYDLKNLGFEHIKKDILLKDNVKQAVDKLLETRDFKLTIKDSWVIIDKETVGNLYRISTVENDVEDVEFFYDKIVKLIIEEEK